VSKRGRDLTADEHKLWRRVASRVKPRKGKAAVKEPEAEEPPARRKALPAAAAAPAKPTRPVVSTVANRGGEKRVRRGKLEIGGILDLHGHTQDSGREALDRFIRSARRRGDRTVVVITGVGRTGEGVLKRRLPEWLNTSELRPIVAGFAQAHRMHGGAGAYYVFLKRADE
jgi:DNA-nicking Smr family endonuclease